MLDTLYQLEYFYSTQTSDQNFIWWSFDLDEYPAYTRCHGLLLLVILWEYISTSLDRLSKDLLIKHYVSSKPICIDVWFYRGLNTYTDWKLVRWVTAQFRHGPVGADLFIPCRDNDHIFLESGYTKTNKNLHKLQCHGYMLLLHENRQWYDRRTLRSWWLSQSMLTFDCQI